MTRTMVGCVLYAVLLVTPTLGNGIARFPDPLPGGGGETMFLLGLYGSRLYGGWSGPPRIELQTPLGTFPDCTMWLPPMHVDPNGHVWGGQIVFYLHNQTQILAIDFSDGHVDTQGFGAGPQTGGTVNYTFTAGGVQVPPGLTPPLQGSWFYFEFHNAQQSPSGPTYTASFTCGARGTLGDLNCDGSANFGDINPFIQALGDPAGYAASYPWCATENADTNNNGAVGFDDINLFIALLGALP